MQHHGVAVVGPLVAVDDDVAVVDVGADLERDVVVDDDLDHADADAQVGARVRRRSVVDGDRDLAGDEVLAGGKAIGG